MKVILVGLNAKFVHSSLGIMCIHENIKDICDVEKLQFTINEEEEGILSSILSYDADLIGFSCYIWNIEQIVKICRNIKKLNKNIKILLGGPEVSYESREFLEKHPYIDFIIRNEGETSTRILILDKLNPRNVDGIVYWNNGQIQENPYVEQDLSKIRLPYENIDPNDLKNKIVYFEASRGCYYRCSYCLSSLAKNIRYFPEDKVKEHLKKLVDIGVNQIKFVDRTFNSSNEKTIEMIRFLKSLDNGHINFHFEITAHIINDELMQELKTARKGLFQLEIGVQSTNANVLKAVNRVEDIEKLSENVKKINSFENMHQHLDLIAGLPYETLEDFKKSFNHVIKLKPQNLQLGFLKMLKGTKIRNEAALHGMVFRDYPPYEILENNYMSYKDIFYLKEIEKILDDYYNSLLFKNIINYLIDINNEAPFELFHNIMEYKKNNGYMEKLDKNDKFKLLFEFCQEFYIDNIDFISQLMVFDYLLMGKNRSVPEFIKINHDIKYDIDDDFILKNLGYDELTKQERNKILRKVHREVFDYDLNEFKFNNRIVNKSCLVAFDYNGNKDFYNNVNHCIINNL